MSKNIALIDKDLTLYSALLEQDNLYASNYFWKNFESYELFCHLSRTKPFDLVILNESTLNVEQLAPDHTIFLNSSICPIIILSNSNESKFTDPQYAQSTYFKIVQKPFRIMTLLSRMGELFENQGISTIQNLRIGHFLLKPFEKVLIGNYEEKLNLTDIEVKILRILSANGNGFVKKEILMEEVWGIKNSLDTHTLETHIYRLRKKLRTQFEKHLVIKSKTGAYAIDYKKREI